MGERLMKYYKYVGDEKGMQGKIQLAQLTKVPSSKASLEPDSSENIELFKKHIQDLTGKPAPSF